VPLPPCRLPAPTPRRTAAAAGPRCRARTGRKPGDGQPAPLGLLLGLLGEDCRAEADSNAMSAAEETDTKALATLEALRGGDG